MTNISQIDQAIILLRERLRQLRSEGGKTASPSKIAIRARSPQPISHLRNIMAIETVPRRDMRRALVRSLLGEAFGNAVSNDLAFQAVADRVTDVLEADPETAKLLDQATEQVKRAR
jgi:hypothetical protein